MRDTLSNLALGLVFALATFAVMWFLYLPHPAAVPHNVVTLAPVARSTDATVPVWAEVREGPDVRYTHVPVGTQCTLLDHAVQLGYGSTALYFEQVVCGHVTGYVNIQNLR